MNQEAKFLLFALTLCGAALIVLLSLSGCGDGTRVVIAKKICPVENYDKDASCICIAKDWSIVRCPQ